MLILGIDPGIARLGWGVISEDKGKLGLIDFGCFETSPKKLEIERLTEIYFFLKKIMEIHRPDVLSVEELFFAANAKTALVVGQARGVILLTASLSHLPVYAYTPLQVKQALSGYGRADKQQMQKMVKSILLMSKVPAPDDAADALAIAITYAFSYKFDEKKNSR